MQGHKAINIIHLTIPHHARSGKFSDQQKLFIKLFLNANNHALSITKPEVTYQSVHLSVCRVIAEGLKSVGLMKGDVEEAVKAGAHAMFLPHGLGHRWE